MDSSEATAEPVRRSSRVRQPTKKAGESQQLETALQGYTRSRSRSASLSRTTAAADVKPASSRKAARSKQADVIVEQDEEDESSAQTEAADGPANGDEDVDHTEASSSSSDDDHSSDDGAEEYCVCREGDDGSPMVWCGSCDEWFHFRCVGVTQAVAEKLSEYTCRSCSKKTGKVSKNLDGSISELSKQASPEDDLSGSPASKRKASVSTDSSLNKRRKPSVSSKPSEARKASTSTADQSDAVRSHVAARFTTILTPIFAMAAKQEGDGEADSSQRSQQYATDLEKHLFESFGEAGPSSSSAKTAGKAYKDRFRTLDFSLRDKTNTTLHSRILTGSLAAAELAVLPSEDLANDSIRARTEKAKLESLQQSILKQEAGARGGGSGGKIRKMTHKGEVEVETDEGLPLNDGFSSMAGRLRESGNDDNRQAKTSKDDSSLPLPSPSSPGNAASSMHRAAARSQSIAEKTGGDADSRSPSATAAQSGSAARLDSPNKAASSTPFDFSNVWAAGQEQAVQGQTDGEADVEENGGAAMDLEGGDVEAQKEYRPAQASDDFIDSFLMGFHSEAGPSNAAENTAAAPATIASPPRPIENPIVWRGAISMPDETTVSGTVRRISGPALSEAMAEDVASNFFPSPCSVIQGRLPSKTAIDYLLQSRVAVRTELLVFSLEKSFELDALRSTPQGKGVAPVPTTQEAHDAAFAQLDNYLQRRQRYAVLLPAPRAQRTIVKDFYLAPLLKDEPIPEWLALNGCESFEGKEQRRDDDMMLLVAVVFKGSMEAAGWGRARPRRSGEQQASTSEPVTGGSIALQDLLKAVGGGGSQGEQTPRSGDSTPSYAPQASSSAVAIDPRTKRPLQPQSAGISSSVHQQAADVAAFLGNASADQGVAAANSLAQQVVGGPEEDAAEKLAQLPEGDIQSILTGNPGLLSNLLKTLGGGSSSDAAVRPPGPPPGPPPPMPEVNPYWQGGAAPPPGPDPYGSTSYGPYAAGLWQQSSYAGAARPSMGPPGPPPPPPPGPVATGAPLHWQPGALAPSRYEAQSGPIGNHPEPMRGPPVRGGSFGGISKGKKGKGKKS